MMPSGINGGLRFANPPYELERLVGRQQLDIDFFRKALRALERPAAQGKPASASSKPLCLQPPFQ